MESERYRIQLEETQNKLQALTLQLENILQCNSKLGIGMDYIREKVTELQSLVEWTATNTDFKANSSILIHKLKQLEKIQKDLEKTVTESDAISCQNTLQDKDLYFQDNPNNLILLTEESSELKDQEDVACEIVEEKTKVTQNDTIPKEIEDEDVLLDLSPCDEIIPEFTSTHSQEFLCSEIKNTKEEAHDSLGPNISEDEGLGEESRRGDSTGPSSFIEIQDSIADLVPLDSPSTQAASPDEEAMIVMPMDEKNIGYIHELSGSKNSLEICLGAIANLRKSLKAKENELLKISGIHSDQRQIAALQNIIINFHKGTNNLKSLLEISEKENATLKEQVLELEEAENDARAQAQRLGEKLLFMQEKDCHSQEELVETKRSLEKCLEELATKESEDQDLRSQLRYMEELVEKYEDQIRKMEANECSLREKLSQQEEAVESLEKAFICPEKFERGSQTYPDTSEIFESQNSRDDSIFNAVPAVSIIDDGLAGQESEDADVRLTNTKETQAVLQNNAVSRELVERSVQTEGDIALSVAQDQFPNMSSKPPSLKFTTTTISSEGSPFSSVECPIQKELLKRLHQLVEEDAHLQQQLHYVDQINLTLWKKLHNLEFHIGECKKRNVLDDGGSDSCIDSESYEQISCCSRPVSREQMSDESAGPSQCESPCANKGIMACLDQSEQEIKDRLLRLEQINAAFEKELEIREKLYLEKERKYGEWIQTEQRFIGDLKRLEDEKELLSTQVARLENEKKELTVRVGQLQAELNVADEKHHQEISRIQAEKEEITSQLQIKVDRLLVQEKEHLKQISNLKSEKNKSTDKAELEKLKSSYIDLQSELSRIREQMRKLEEEFRRRFEEAQTKHTLEETRLLAELERLRTKNSSYNELIKNFQTRQTELMNVLAQKESELEEARLVYKKNMEATEEEHRLLETELKNQLRQMEEGTAVATQALTEERIRLERQLQENIDDLRSKEEMYKARIAELENNVSHLHEEVHRITGDLDSGLQNESGQDSIKREKLLKELRELREREADLREKLDEMEQKEAAYRETLEHADRIVASVEQGYKNKIEELEISERNLKQRVGHLEEIESTLRESLHKERRSSDGRKPDDLVFELLEAEARETTLKEKIDHLEVTQRKTLAKIKELEKVREELESQVNDRDELAATLKRTQFDLEIAKKSIAKLKLSEIESQKSLQNAENALATMETQMKKKIRALQEGKKDLEETIAELRNQVEVLKAKLDLAQKEQRIPRAFPKQPSGPPQIEMEDIDYAEVEGAGSSSLEATHLSNSKPPSANTSSLEALPKQGTVTNAVGDCYEQARKNLEDCMMRAMATMTMNIENQGMDNNLASDNHDYDEVLPRPTNFRVVQQVGSDTLLVGWDYVNPSILEGFELYLDGHLQETVYTADRTKALLSGLDLSRPLHLSICALSRCGQMSEAVSLELPSLQERSNGFLFQDDDEEDEDALFEDTVFEKQRPYSMEW